SAGDVLERGRQAAGGDRWDDVHSLRIEGRLEAGGLQGTVEMLVDVRSGRSVAHYRLGPVEGANGYDGRVAWTRDPGGEVLALDAAEALRAARSQAWLDARAYWYPSRGTADWSEPQARELDGTRHDVLVATPA